MKFNTAFWLAAVSLSGVQAQGAAWAQCGGTGWSGSKSCVSGYTCVYVNDYYSQCQPGSNPPATTTQGQSPTNTAGTGALCSQYAYLSANGYDINNNLWGTDTATGGSQCTYYNGPVGNGISFSSPWNWQGDKNTVKSYIYAGRQFTPKLVSQISRLPTTAQWSYTNSNMGANVAYDIFTASDPNHEKWFGDYELMIWLGAYGGVQPISKTGQPIARVNLAGHSWDLYWGYNGEMSVYSFKSANGQITNFNADVKEFWNYLAQNQGYPASSQYMLIYQFGTEAFVGGPTEFRVSKFEANVQ